MAHDIFISYSTVNQGWAESALRLFEAQGLSCWMAPRDIRPGSTWAAEIVHGISNARVMLLLLSSASNQSRQVAREVQLADSSQLRIIPVLLEAVKPEGDFVYFLSNTQWLTALGGSAADHSKTLLAAVGEALNASPPKPETAIAPPEPALQFSPSQAVPEQVPPLAHEPPPRPMPPIGAASFASPASPATALTSRPLFWGGIGVAVVVICAAFWLMRPSPKPEEESRQPQVPATAAQETPATSMPPNRALAGTWKGDVGTNPITIQIQVQPGDRVVVLVDNQAAKTEQEPAEVIKASGGFLEMYMGNPPRARCSLRLASDRRNLEGTWIQNPPPRPGFRVDARPVQSGPEKPKPTRTFNVVFTKVD